MAQRFCSVYCKTSEWGEKSSYVKTKKTSSVYPISLALSGPSTLQPLFVAKVHHHAKPNHDYPAKNNPEIIGGPFYRVVGTICF